MELEERLERLEEGHFALAAQHVALMQVSKIMFPLIALNAKDTETALTLIYDRAGEYMDNADMDSTFQQAVRTEIDAFSSLIFGVARISAKKAAR